jgi:hypothetical protein
MAVNKDLAKIESDARSILAILPKSGQIRFKKKFGPIVYNKTYKLRPYALNDRIFLAEKYGEKNLVAIFSDPNSISFIKIHADIIFNAMSEKDKRDFGTFEKFLERIDSPAREVEMLLIALELRGLAENPKLTAEELKEVLDGIKKK